MELSRYVSQLRSDLAVVAGAGDQKTQEIGSMLGAAIEPAARLAIMGALSDLAAEVTAALGDRVVEVRLDGRDVRVAVDGAAGGQDGAHGAADAPPHAEPPGPDATAGPNWSSWRSQGFGGAFGGFGPDGGDISRVTLRLVEQMKNQAERAAAEQGVSLNAWVAQAVQGALSGHGPGQHGGPGGFGKRDRRSERRVKGWVQG